MRRTKKDVERAKQKEEKARKKLLVDAKYQQWFQW
jgi:hypothetical protein